MVSLEELLGHARCEDHTGSCPRVFVCSMNILVHCEMPPGSVMASFNSKLLSSLYQVLDRHCHILGRGLMVSMPTILGRDIPVVNDSTEQLKDFIESKLETAGGRLAR